MGGRILVVHRNELILDAIQEMLQNVGYAVTLACEGQRALGKALAGRYNLIIVDRNLEGQVDGVRLVELLRKYGVRSPILGTAPDADWADDATDQVDRLLSSPFEYDELVRAVADLLDRRSPPEAAAPALPVLPEPPSLPEAPVQTLPSPTVRPAPAPKASGPAPRPGLASARPAAPPAQPPSRRLRAWEPRRIERREGPPRILIADSADDTRAVLTGTLEGSGYQVAAFKSGSDAYEAALLADYELIILDLWTTGMDGFETLSALRKSGVEAPAVILTGYVTKEMVRELLPWKIRKVLLKPADPKLLLRTIAEIVPA